MKYRQPPQKIRGRHLPRRRDVERLRRLLATHPVVGILGPRQVGKTTLARDLVKGRRQAVAVFDLEDPAELDLLVVRGRRRWGFELKRTSAPTVSRSMHVAVADLRLERLDVVHGGAHSFPLAPRIRAVALARLLEDRRPLG
ncbi:MAG TPA: AAA family ATPase [Vicinamibacteria bacterium]